MHTTHTFFFCVFFYDILQDGEENFGRRGKKKGVQKLITAFDKCVKRGRGDSDEKRDELTKQIMLN